MWPDFALVQTLVFAPVQETVRMAQGQVLTGAERRRRWSDEQKRAIVAAALAPGAVIADVARRADVCSSLIYRWRREWGAAPHGFAEVILDHRGGSGGLRCHSASSSGGTGCLDLAAGDPEAAIEIELPGSSRVRIPASISPELAAAVIAALLRR